MKRLNVKTVFLSLALASFVFMLGCAGTGQPHYKPVTVPDILQMTKNGVPADQIIHKMKQSRTVYRLKADQLAKLEQQGVSPKVVDYMQQTYLKAVQRDQALEDWSYWWPGWDGYWYGGPAFGWPYWGFDDEFWDQDFGD